MREYISLNFLHTKYDLGHKSLPNFGDNKLVYFAFHYSTLILFDL